MYSHMYFEAKRNADPEKLGVPGVSATSVINEIMRRKNLSTCYIIDSNSRNTIRNIYIDIRHKKFDIIYINAPLASESLYEYMVLALGMLSDKGYLLVDFLFPYYPEFNDTSYQAFVKARQTIHGYQYNMLWDCSYGLGVITKGEDQYATYGLGDGIEMDYKAYEYFFALCMNPVDTKTFLNTLEVKESKYKYSVLTCIFDGYEVVREVPDPREDVEYVLVTDDPTITSDTWKVICVDSFFDNMSGYAKAFYVKYHPFEFVESDTFIWIDGSIQIKKDFTDELMMPFINSDYEVLELINTITNIGKDELDRWRDHGFHGFDDEQCEIAKKLFENEPWIDETQVQTTIYCGKNTRLLNMINNRTWDIMRRDSGAGHDVTILYMPQRGQIISKYIWNTHKVYYIEASILFSSYFDYCYHRSTESQYDEWHELGDDILIHDIWGEGENPLYPKKIK